MVSTRNVVAAVVGAVVAYIWTTFSWMVLPWHEWDMHSFKNDGKTVMEAVKAESDKSGIYFVPNMPAKHEPSEEKAWQEKATKGPFAYMVVSVSGAKWGMPISLLVHFLTQLMVAAAAVWLLMKSSVRTFAARAIFIGAAVTLGTFLVEISNWNWWHFPFTFALVNIVDVLLAWLLAGLAIGLIVKKKA